MQQSIIRYRTKPSSHGAGFRPKPAWAAEESEARTSATRTRPA
jgi:hypothetical protein